MALEAVPLVLRPCCRQQRMVRHLTNRDRVRARISSSNTTRGIVTVVVVVAVAVTAAAVGAVVASAPFQIVPHYLACSNLKLVQCLYWGEGRFSISTSISITLRTRFPYPIPLPVSRRTSVLVLVLCPEMETGGRVLSSAQRCTRMQCTRIHRCRALEVFATGTLG